MADLYNNTIPEETKQAFWNSVVDAENVDMNEVVKFYRSFSEKDKNENAKLIHQYAKEHADMAVVMRPIVEYIK